MSLIYYTWQLKMTGQEAVVSCNTRNPFLINIGDTLPLILANPLLALIWIWTKKHLPFPQINQTALKSTTICSAECKVMFIYTYMYIDAVLLFFNWRSSIVNISHWQQNPYILSPFPWAWQRSGRSSPLRGPAPGSSESWLAPAWGPSPNQTKFQVI